MKRTWLVALLLVALAAFIAPALPFLSNGSTVQAAGPATYRVLVGAENVPLGISLMAYFPATLRIHVGDTITWLQNSHEIHTVTFLAGTPTPGLILPAPQPNPINAALMFNPAVAFPTAPAGGQYNGSTYANSGIMSLDPGQSKSFSLTFTKTGTYPYLCLVHGQMMSGEVIVVDASVPLPSPNQVVAAARAQIAQEMAKAPAAVRLAQSKVPKPTHNPNGTTTYHVMVGFTQGTISIMRFFPSQLVVKQGDTVEWTLGDAPHTITFLNGNPDIPFAVFVPPPQGPLLLLNPQAMNPINPGKPLTRQGVYSSGILGLGPQTSYSLQIGNIVGQIAYECLLHDTSGMKAILTVVRAQ
jgi:plastocyanin